MTKASLLTIQHVDSSLHQLGMMRKGFSFPTSHGKKVSNNNKRIIIILLRKFLCLLFAPMDTEYHYDAFDDGSSRM